MGFMKRLEVTSETEATKWINDDIKPIEAERRTWTFWTFHNYCESPLQNFFIEADEYRDLGQLKHFDVLDWKLSHRFGIDLVAGNYLYLCFPIFEHL